MFELAMFLMAILLTVGIGVPLAARAARVHVWRTTFGKDPTIQRELLDAAGFVPLDLGPDPTLWPSQVDRTSMALAEPKWPSQTWENDEHFGAFWRTHEDELSVPAPIGGGRARPQPKAPARPQPKAQNRPKPKKKKQQPAKRPAPVDDNAPNPVVQRLAEEARVKAEREAHEATQRAINEMRERAQQVAAPVPKSVKKGVKKAAAQGPYTRAEVEKMIGDVGLAGAVQQIMSKTGWDFRKAAQYLAKIRKG